MVFLMNTRYIFFYFFQVIFYDKKFAKQHYRDYYRDLSIFTKKYKTVFFPSFFSKNGYNRKKISVFGGNA